jgi:hypothetical protein
MKIKTPLMTFGLIKSIIEENILDSYKDEKSFKKAINEFKHNILNNKDIAKVYSIYDELSKPQGLSEDDAKEFLQEGISIIQGIIKNIKLPKIIGESNVSNKYSKIDELIYEKSKIDLHERIKTKKEIVSTLKESRSEISKKISLPVSTMIKIANQTLNSYIENLDENTKKEFFQIIKEDSKTLENKFNEFRNSTIEKLTSLVTENSADETKSTIEETIKKVKEEQFSQINFLKLKSLNDSL